MHFRGFKNTKIQILNVSGNKGIFLYTTLKINKDKYCFNQNSGPVLADIMSPPPPPPLKFLS